MPDIAPPRGPSATGSSAGSSSPVSGLQSRDEMIDLMTAFEARASGQTQDLAAGVIAKLRALPGDQTPRSTGEWRALITGDAQASAKASKAEFARNLGERRKARGEMRRFAPYAEMERWHHHDSSRSTRLTPNFAPSDPGRSAIGKNVQLPPIRAVLGSYLFPPGILAPTNPADATDNAPA